MAFTFRPATRSQIRLLIGVSGGTGSGKTYSAMRLAKGLSGDKRFAVIDTENGRASMYADYFDFDVLELTEPFSPDRYLEAIVAAEKQGYPVILVDSMSHEWAGDGGILDMQEDALEKMAGSDWQKREACRMASWVKPKMAHKAMVSHLLQLRAHVIMAFRAEPKVEMIKNDRGKMEVVPRKSLTGLDGWIPITEKNLPYELTCSFLVMPDRPGVPLSIKLQEQHKPFFPLDKPITEECGRLIGEWAAGGTPKVETKPPKREPKPKPEETKPLVIETKLGVYEMVSDIVKAKPWTEETTVQLLKKIESAASENQLLIYAEIIKTAPDAAKEWLRPVYGARLKQLRTLEYFQTPAPVPSPAIPEEDPVI